MNQRRDVSQGLQGELMKVNKAQQVNRRLKQPYPRRPHRSWIWLSRVVRLVAAAAAAAEVMAPVAAVVTLRLVVTRVSIRVNPV